MFSYLLSSMTVAGAAVLVWAVVRRGRALPPLLVDGPEATLLVVDDSGLSLERPGDPTRAVEWDELVAVRIRTSDVGPFAEDLHWEFDTANVPASLVVPGGASGIDDLLAIVSDRLAGFDHEGVIEAMGSVENRVFELWSA